MTDGDSRSHRVDPDQAQIDGKLRQMGADVLRKLIDLTETMPERVPRGVDPAEIADHVRRRVALLDAASDVVESMPAERPADWQPVLATALNVWLTADPDLLAAVLAAALIRLDERRRQRPERAADHERRHLRAVAEYGAAMVSGDTQRAADLWAEIVRPSATPPVVSVADRLTPLDEQAPSRAQAEAESQATIREAEHRIALDNARAEGRNEVLAWMTDFARRRPSVREAAALRVAVDEYRRQRLPDLASITVPTVRHAGLRCRTCSAEMVYDQTLPDPDRCVNCQTERASTPTI